MIHNTLSTGNERYTPQHVIEAARGTLGTIHMDPASCAEANERVNALKYYTKENDGLHKEWRGNVWLNPPYGGKAKLWVNRLLDKRDWNSAILLINGDCSTKAYQRAMKNCTSACLFSPRLSFAWPGGEVKKGNSSTNAAFLFTRDSLTRERFSLLFGPRGVIVRAIS